jgi:ketosteroid isomerase-like protein
MSERTLEHDLAAVGETDAVATLHELNANYIRAFVESDVEWYREHLSADFVCTLADGRRIDKAAFLQRTEEGPGVVDVTYDEIDVRLLGELAIVHGVTHYVRDGSRGSTRYTDVWQWRGGRWQAVAAQLTWVAAE